MWHQLIKERKSTMKFKSIYKRDFKPKAFDPDRTIIRGGKKFVVRQLIQESRSDTEIYPTLEKYGTLENAMEHMKKNLNKIYADFGAVTTLKDTMDQQIQAQQLWNDLPFQVRAHFNNNIHTFLKEGEKYLKEMIEANKPKETIATPEKPKETVAEVKGE